VHDVGPDRRWNHNIHYHRLILEAVPPGARTALDVGTGDGLLARDLRRVVPQVTGLDVDPTVLATARALDDGVAWVQGDVRTHPFPLESFDVVASVAVLHHLPDTDAALRRMADLTAPGGLLAIVGLARSSTPLDRAADVAGVLQHRLLVRRRQVWEHSAPVVWPPSHTYSEVRRAAARVLPGMRWRRLPLWRYAILWTKPRSVRAETPAEALLRLAARVPRVAPEV
jgi:2-polyprenyl-3-methyl-5-hydroxy-6-metoxy-1,4-benzoquinol methylase